MSVRSAEVANKQHLEGVKKIAKLEAECQRLRGLVRKKLPGPAALAQMKLEVENLGRDYGEPRLRRSPMTPTTTHFSQMPEFSLENSLKYQKENELLTERLLEMDEQTRMLKEALANRNSELQASRSICAQTASKLQNLEAQLRANAQVSTGGFSSQKVSDQLMSEDGNDDNVSCAGSLATVSMSELSYIQKEKNADSPHKSENTNHLDLMDDFLEMEKIACLPHGSNGAVSSSDVSVNTGNTGSELVKHEDDAKINVNSCIDTVQTNDQALEMAISGIYDFVMILGKEAKALPGSSDEDGLIKKAPINSEINLFDFVLDISHVLSKATLLDFNVLGFKSSEVETSTSDCIDKIALPENKAVVDPSGERYSNGSSQFSDSASDPDVPSDGNLVPTSESTATSRTCSLEEFEQLKMDKDSLEVDLARCTESFESTNSKIQQLG
ncbi:hypothetical protein DH2020_008028 [Rehmannia glutinosa]|uniref:Filament-like plant protein n=1 Tax=Rehmannia glutinosa TaxID=99300 RepID=A0ABR0TZT7_REHGL